MAEHKTKSIHLLQRLMDRINCEYEDLSYSQCANYLVDNYDRLQDISMQELCEKNFVSKSTVRRFFQNMGYKNFSELKLSKTEERKNGAEDSSADFLSDKISIKNSDFEKILALMEEHSSVYILFPNELYFAAYEFQWQMSEINRIIYLVPNIDLHFSLIEKLLDTSLVFVLDYDEDYTLSLKEYLKNVKGKLVFISTEEKNDNIVIESKEENINKKYLYLYFFDLLVSLYRNRERLSFP